jgi:quercetin dioxygenase-like cupin family protein
MTAGVVREATAEYLKVVRPGISRAELIPAGPYAENMSVHQFNLEPGGQVELTDGEHDQYLYMLDGEANISISGHVDIGHEASAAFAHAAEKFTVNATAIGASFILAQVPAPVTPWAEQLKKPTSGKRDFFTKIGASALEAATGDREFQVLFNADNGSRGATMFVGFIPSSGAPQHYHLYDEVCVIVRGHGALHTTDHPEQILRKGSAFRVSNRYLHAIHNPNPEDLWILGIFRPEGSAAAAFYPDGRPAPVSK